MGSSPGALRIDRDDLPPNRTTFRLGGRLGLLELETLCRSVEPSLGSGREVELDLGDLRFLDDRGARLLCALRTRGARIARATGYVRELLSALEKER